MFQFQNSNIVQRNNFYSKDFSGLVKRFLCIAAKKLSVKIAGLI